MPLFNPVSTGGGGVPKATVTGTTGSPTVDSSSRPGKTIYRFTGSGTITVDTAGSVELLVVGGGGGGSYQTNNSNLGPVASWEDSGGGAGGVNYSATAFFPAGTHTVVVGTGGSPGPSTDTEYGKGLSSYISFAGGNGSSYVALGGGSAFQQGSGNSYPQTMAKSGGSGGGQTGLAYNDVSYNVRGNNLVSGQGQPGGWHGYTCNQGMGSRGPGGGGGWANSGGAATGCSYANGGNGFTTTINGSSVTYAGGGAGTGRYYYNCGCGQWVSTWHGGSGGSGGGGGFNYQNNRYDYINNWYNATPAMFAQNNINNATCGTGGGGAASKAGASGIVIVVVG